VVTGDAAIPQKEEYRRESKGFHSGGLIAKCKGTISQPIFHRSEIAPLIVTYHRVYNEQ
jgi:hypothetical protein